MLYAMLKILFLRSYSTSARLIPAFQMNDSGIVIDTCIPIHSNTLQDAVWRLPYNQLLTEASAIFAVKHRRDVS